MKKFLSVAIAAAMLISLIAVIAAIPAAAVDGMWNVYSVAGDYYPSEEEILNYNPVPGYEYTSEGLKVIPPVWKDTTPKFGLQTKDVVDLKEGVYLEIRIDEFTFGGDMWFSFNITDQQYCVPGTKNVAKYGESIQTLIRPGSSTDVKLVQWYHGAFIWDAQNEMTNSVEDRFDENGKMIVALTITWDGSTYAMDINGAPAPASTIAYMNDHYANGEGYVGFNVQNSNKNGTAACTVLKYGTDKETATAPTGDDSAEPINHSIEIAEIADPSTVPAGQPAIFINGSRDKSDARGSTGLSGTGNTRLNEDGTFRYIANSNHAEIGMYPKNEISYSIDDFPVIIALTRNFCTCELDGECLAFESANMYIMTGEYIAADSQHRVAEIDMCYEPIVKGEDTYLYFYVDTTDISWDAEGRFNGARFDPSGILFDTPGRNSFDMCFLALFRTVEEAEAYVYNWIGVEENVPGDDQETVDTDNAAGDETENENDTPAGEATTEAPADEATTEAPNNDNNNTNNNTASNSGCDSSVGFGAAAMVALVAGAGTVAYKRKRK